KATPFRTIPVYYDSSLSKPELEKRRLEFLLSQKSKISVEQRIKVLEEENLRLKDFVQRKLQELEKIAKKAGYERKLERDVDKEIAEILNKVAKGKKGLEAVVVE